MLSKYKDMENLTDTLLKLLTLNRNLGKWRNVNNLFLIKVEEILKGRQHNLVMEPGIMWSMRILINWITSIQGGLEMGTLTWKWGMV